MDCTLDQHLLEEYLDGELGFERTLDVEAHLASCRGCASEVQSWKDVRGVTMLLRASKKKSELWHRARIAASGFRGFSDGSGRKVELHLRQPRC